MMRPVLLLFLLVGASHLPGASCNDLNPQTACPRVVVHGTVLTRMGTPVAGAEIRFWQRDENEDYFRPLDGEGLWPEYLDSFQYFGTTRTDSDGKYELRTYRNSGIHMHIHYQVFVPSSGGGGGEEWREILTSIIFFGDEEHNREKESPLEIASIDGWEEGDPPIMTGGDFDEYAYSLTKTIVIARSEAMRNSTSPGLLELTPSRESKEQMMMDFSHLGNDLTQPSPYRLSQP
jgi:Dioxygenase